MGVQEPSPGSPAPAPAEPHTGSASGRAAGDLVSQDDVLADLAERTLSILERQQAVDPEQARAEAEQEKAVVAECRYLMRLLSSRRRSAGEMRSRLEERGLTGSMIHEVMARMDRAGLIDDAEFARTWVRERRALKSLADRALRRELEAKHVGPRDIEEALAEPDVRSAVDASPGALLSSSQESSARQRDPMMSAEEERCRDLVRSRLRQRDLDRLRDDADGSERRRIARRMDGLLARKGYDGDLAVRVISSELREAATA